MLPVWPGAHTVRSVISGRRMSGRVASVAVSPSISTHNYYEL